MGTVYDKYEAVIGLEIHAQLDTKSKAYSTDKNEFGSTPNTNVSVVSLGHPGTLPMPNIKFLSHAVKMGIACNCKITEFQNFARKNYFYPDLPKGYQITQDKTPICTEGSLEIKDDKGEPKKIGITRIHIEEDSGKSMHDQDPFNTLIDLNRAGVPLVEIVSEPEIKTSTEAYNYVTEIRKIVRYLEICDGNMEEGSMRCDANISVMLKGSNKFGTRVEVKNMNSMRNVQRAIEHEIKRQIDAIEANEVLVPETRNFDATTGTTTSMRGKEDAHDYRYFPEPDLQPIKVTQGYIEKQRKLMPPLPNQLIKKYVNEFKLSNYDATILTDIKEIALFFEEIILYTSNYKAAANWVMGNIKSYLNQKAIELKEFPIHPKYIGELINLISENKISNTLASQKVFPKMIEEPEKSPLKIAQENNWIQDNDEEKIIEMIEDVLANNTTEVNRYKAGEKNLVGFFMGQLMKASKGKVDPKSANQILRKMLEK